MDASKPTCADDCVCVPMSDFSDPTDFTIGGKLPWKAEVCEDGYPMVHNEGDIICHADPKHLPGCKWDLARFRLIAAAPKLLAACREAAKTFRRYEELHRAKGTEEGHEKARANREQAEALEAAIAQAEGR